MQTNSKAKETLVVKHAIIIEKYTSNNPSGKTEVEMPTRSSFDDDASVIPQGCCQEKVQCNHGCYSNENVTATISRPKHIRRKSYTSSLVSRSEVGHSFQFFYICILILHIFYVIDDVVLQVMGESASLVNKHELLNIDNSSNPLEVVEYVDDIYQYYWSLEVMCMRVILILFILF